MKKPMTLDTQFKGRLLIDGVGPVTKGVESGEIDRGCDLPDNWIREWLWRMMACVIDNVEGLVR